MPYDITYMWNLKNNTNEKRQLLSHVQLFATPWTVSHQASLSMGFPRQEHWNEQLFPSAGDLPYSGIKPVLPALQADSLPSEPPGKPTQASLFVLNLDSFVLNLYTDLQAQKTIVMVTKVQKKGRRTDQGYGINRHKLPYIKQTIDKDSLYSTENYTPNML